MWDAGGASLPAHPKKPPFTHPSRRFGATAVREAQEIFWEGGTETRGKASGDGRRKKIRGRTAGRKRVGTNAAPFPPAAVPGPPPEKASRCHHHLPHLPPSTKSLHFRYRRGEIAAQPLTLQTRVWGPEGERWGFQRSPSPQCLGPMCMGLVFLPASPEMKKSLLRWHLNPTRWHV